MSTFTSSDTHKQQNESTTEDVAQQFLSASNEYFQSELKCMFISF